MKCAPYFFCLAPRPRQGRNFSALSASAPLPILRGAPALPRPLPRMLAFPRSLARSLRVARTFPRSLARSFLPSLARTLAPSDRPSVPSSPHARGATARLGRASAKKKGGAARPRRSAQLPRAGQDSSSFRPSVRPSVRPSSLVRPSVRPSVCLSVCPSVRPSSVPLPSVSQRQSQGRMQAGG
jgi:hypothetical protein